MAVSSVTGVVDPSFLYVESEAARRMGWGRHALIEAKKRGLKVMRSGKRNYILGRDLVQFVLEDSAKPNQVGT